MSAAITLMEQFDAAVAAELPRISTLQYNSHEICEFFAANVRKRLASLANHPQAMSGAALAAGERKDAWISVDERLPELGPDEAGVSVWTWNGVAVDDDEFVACYEQPAGPAVVGWLRVDDWFAADTMSRVTHWQLRITPPPPAAIDAVSAPQENSNG